jgi:hypothetical protein
MLEHDVRYEYHARLLWSFASQSPDDVVYSFTVEAEQ